MSSPFTRHRLVVAGALLLGLSVVVPSAPVSAAGAQVLVEGGVLRVTGTASSESLYITTMSTTSMEVSDYGRELVLGAGCSYRSNFSKSTATCTSALFTRIVVRAGDGNDYVQVRENYTDPPPVDAEVHLGPGDDSASTGNGRDVIAGEDGNDKQLNGGPGADVLRGGPGDDSGFVGDGSGNGWDAT